ncbi:MAG TPA: TIGR01777 family oxidoreductase [Anaeromyxobacteraceae bacterium]|nr:TIGR01777 family oxidoreductase [Anaeromyxobacteraceae bacterium]
MRVFVTGATGLVGRPLCAALLARGHEVVALTRAAPAWGRLPEGVRAVVGDPTRAGPWLEELAGCDACVHLAGEPVAGGRWSPARKRAIESSRIDSAAVVAGLLAARGPRVLVQGSAVGYYGSRGDEPLDESSGPGDDFLAGVTQRWEAAAAPARGRARVVLLRTGMVLAPAGGALGELVKPFRLLAGGPVGSPAAWKPWIHLADEVGLVLWALEDARVDGPLNACAPHPARNRDLAAAIGAALRRPSLVTVPDLAVRLLLGELSSVVLASQRAVPGKALALGYRFRFPELRAALEDLLR